MAVISLNGQASNKDNLNAIMKVVDLLFEEGKQGLEGLPKYKHYARWAYWWSSRVNPDGTFNDVVNKNQEALEKFNKENSTNTRGNEAVWNFIGPDKSSYATDASFCKGNGYGRVDRISFHPTNASKIYVCTPLRKCSLAFVNSSGLFTLLLILSTNIFSHPIPFSASI